jgi:hypothetical protein
LLTGENVSRFKWPLLRDECGREGSKVCGGGIIGAGMRMRCVGVAGANRWEPDRTCAMILGFCQSETQGESFGCKVSQPFDSADWYRETVEPSPLQRWQI